MRAALIGSQSSLERHEPSSSPSDDSSPIGATVIPAPLGVRSVTLTIIAVLATIVLLKYAQALIIPVVIGILISYALDPVVTRMTAIGLPRPTAAAIVILVVVAVGGSLVYQLRFQTAAIVEQLPDAARRLRRTIERDTVMGDTAIKKVQRAATELERAADMAPRPPTPAGVMRVQVEPSPFSISDYLMWGSMGVAAALMQAVMILFLAFFLLSSGDLYRRKLVKIAGPSLTQKKVTVQILQEIDRQIASFLGVQVFTSVIVGVASWLAFLWVGLEQAAVWGVMAGVFNSIPYFGPVLVTSGIAGIAFMQFGALEMAATTAGLALVITSLEGFLLTPYLTSRTARMNAGAVFVGVLFWGWVWNVWGVLLAVPMLTSLKAVCDRVEDFKAVGELLGD